jgi:hypothetical protein
MVRTYDMATGRLIHNSGSNTKATVAPEGRQATILCPSLALQELPVETADRGMMPADLAQTPVEQILDRQK